MKFLVIICFILLSCVGTWANRARYDNYKVYRLFPKTNDEIHQLYQLEKNDKNLKFWKVSTSKHRPSDILVPPHRDAQFQDILKKSRIYFGLMIENLQSLIDETKPRVNQLDKYGWDDYYNLTMINNWIDEMVEQYPSVLKKIVIGKSYEGRDITGVKLSFAENNKAVFLEGGIHAREWISPAVITYILHAFINSDDETLRDVAESYDWYFFPVCNPDGFEYTHTTDRLWRMTRQPHGLCVGADPNRNWPYHWNEGGASNNSCEETYAGPQPFSEPETKALSDFLTSINRDLIGFISLHSYSQLLLIPYGYNNKHVENYEECMEIGQLAINSLAQRYGTKYEVGNMAETIYVASGVSPDWVKGTFHTPLTFTYELRDTGKHGFILPPDQIIPTCEETLDSIITIMIEAKKRGYK